MPRVKFTLWDDYAVMTMVEKNLGVGILPSLILRKIPYSIITGKSTYRPVARLASLSGTGKALHGPCSNSLNTSTTDINSYLSMSR